MSEARNVLIVGATGIVGRGIARAMTEAGWSVTGVGRDADRLEALTAEVGGVTARTGSIASDADAAALAASLREGATPFDAIVVSVNLPTSAVPLLDCSSDELLAVLQGNLVTHLCAARALFPLLRLGGRYVGIGGGMADFTLPGMGPISICQAAQRNMFRFLAVEGAERDISVVELMLYSHIVDPTDDAEADPRAIRANEVGAHVLAVIERPGEFAGSILALKSRKQVGYPQRD